MTESEQLELIKAEKTPRKREAKQEERVGRMGILILLVVTTAISLVFYLKQRVGEIKIEMPEINIGGTETITIEK